MRSLAYAGLAALICMVIPRAYSDEGGPASGAARQSGTVAAERIPGSIVASGLAKESLIHPQGGANPRSEPVVCTGSTSNLMYPVTGAYTLVDFFGDGCSGNRCATGTDQHNDDDSASLSLPFTFNLYGTNYTSCFVNNNGNLSFDGAYNAFSSSGFPVSGYPLVAPFWADVDTGSPADPVGEVWMRYVDSNSDGRNETLVVTWDRAGYYSNHGNYRNTFQVVISDGTNSRMGANNVCFSYDNMCWTTGDASGGTGGYGGTPATAGANKGDGTNYFQIGRFDHDAYDYDGPFGNNDGVSHMDGQTICFNTSSSASNIPPIPVNFPNGNEITINAGTNQVLDLTLQFLSPEANQSTTVSVQDVNGVVGRGLAVTNTSGNVAVVRLYWAPSCSHVGSYRLNFAATDNFSPPATANAYLIINVICPCTAPSITQQPTSRSVCTGQSVTFTCAAGGTGPLTYQWQKGGVDIAGASSASYTINPVVAGSAGSYACRVSNSCGSATTNSATLSVTAGPSISAHPSSQSVCDGASVTFVVVANGAGPFTYQWQKNTVDISGATGLSYTINPVTSADAGSYRCAVSNTCGPVTSNAATLTVTTAPTITLHPSDRSVCDGGSAAFVVSATGTAPLAYQWQKNGANISGASATTYIINPVSAASAGQYRCVVSNSCGAATSNAATLTVGSGVTITQQPANQAVCLGGAATFSVTAVGDGLGYQWQKNSANISGATASSYTINPVIAGSVGQYRVLITSACGSATSNQANLTLNSGPSITQHPQGATICSSGSVTFSVVGSGTAPLAYQWQKNAVNIAGATASTYTINPAAAADAGSYRAILTDACGSVTSNNAVLTVDGGPAIAVQPADQTVCVGGSATFSVTATGSSLSYQWQKNSANISGATAASYTINPVVAGDAGNYRVLVSNTCGLVISNQARLTVGTGPTITVQPADQSVCPGGSATFTVVANGSGLTYQWQKNTVNIGGATTASYVINPVAAGDAGSFRVIVSNTCGAVTSNAATLTVGALPVITVQPLDATACPGDTVLFSVTATGSAPLAYQWQKNSVNIGGATASSYTIVSVAAGDAANYRVLISNACGSVTSNTARLTLGAGPSITQHPADQAVCPGGSATFSVAAGAGGATYQWQKNAIIIPGATAASLTISPVAAGDVGSYRAIVTTSCGSTTSGAALLSLTAGPTITAQPVGQAVCPGAPVTFSVTVGGAGPLSYQWQKSGSNIGGANADSYTIAAAGASDAGSYRVIVANACGAATSDAATLVINSPPAITQQPLSQAVCPGASVSFSVSASGTGPLAYQWQKDGANLGGAGGASYTIGAAAGGDAGEYRVIVTNACGSITSEPATLAINTAPVISAQPVSQTVCPGASVTFAVTAGGTTPLTYQWQKDGANIPAANGASHGIPAVGAGDAGSYLVVISNACGSVTSDVATLTLNAAPSFTRQPADVSACPGLGATFSVAAAGAAPLSYQWQHNGVDIAGAVGSSHTIDPVLPADFGQYRVMVTNACGSVTSQSASLTMGSGGLRIDQQPASQTVCSGQTLVLTIVASGSPAPTYQWRKDGVGLQGATSSTYTLSPATDLDSGTYDVQIGNACGQLISDAATIIVWPTGSGDINGDGAINGLDILTFVDTVRTAAHGPAGLAFCAADMNHDGAVNYLDVPPFLGAMLAP